jgi:hypothetical protein
MNQNSETASRLATQLDTIAASLDAGHSSAYFQALAIAVRSAQSMAADRPADWPPLTSALLAWASTRADSPQLATALSEASRAWAAVWGLEYQAAAFRAELDGFGH